MRKLGPIQYRHKGSWFYPVFVCASCGADLDKSDGVIVWDMSLDDPPIYAACRGQCHDLVEAKVDERAFSHGWVSLEDFIGSITNNAGFEVAGKCVDTGFSHSFTLKRKKTLSST